LVGSTVISSAAGARLIELRKQYSFWPGEQGCDAWDVDRLIELSRDFEVEDVPLEALWQIDENYWLEPNIASVTPTVRRIVEHLQLTLDVDMTYPITPGLAKRVMDGMHRVAWSLLHGYTSIRAVRFSQLPEPDYENAGRKILRTERASEKQAAEAPRRGNPRSDGSARLWLSGLDHPCQQPK
jgi:hypothetical protein